LLETNWPEKSINSSEMAISKSESSNASNT
jgi:hypothetical protein